MSLRQVKAANKKFQEGIEENRKAFSSLTARWLDAEREMPSYQEGFKQGMKIERLRAKGLVYKRNGVWIRRGK